ncbi:serine/threonine-protein kinase ULK3-like [Daphnia pulicaria]|uniref:serine/threonine-protein kinase ULK3-like n=1 Tax=Daphnia pulicaria TaxID=35523 RepID=UPI001EE9DDDA|nr:serine/threonine-protein kinase ULK3-like [Daphnia pulicaria]
MPLPRLPGFVLQSKIGSGTFSDVYKAYQISSPKQIVAVKCILKNELSANTVNSIVHEIEALKRLRHPHIIQMLDFQWDENFIYIIMEYCEGGDLSIFIRNYKQLKEDICRSFLSQLAFALQYLRQHNIVHMDLKPSNLLLTSRRHPVLKLADFGLAQSLKNREKETSYRGSPLYMAPEILRRQSYDASVDLWSTGVILYECLFGRPPCSSKSLKELVDKIQSDAPITIPTTIEISSNCRDLLIRLLQKDPNKRLTFEQFFNHPFVNLPACVLQRLLSSNSGLLEANSVFERAENSYKSNRGNETLILYRQAHALLKPLISGADAVTKSKLSGQLHTCSCRIKEMSIVPEVPSTQLTKSNVSTTFQELRSLASATPNLASALEIGKEGVQYDSEGQHVIALERYKAALDVMIPMLRHESKGRRRDLLHQQVTLWMERAEQLQEFHNLQQSQLEELQAEDASGQYCCIQ